MSVVFNKDLVKRLENAVYNGSRLAEKLLTAYKAGGLSMGELQACHPVRIVAVEGSVRALKSIKIKTSTIKEGSTVTSESSDSAWKKSTKSVNKLSLREFINLWGEEVSEYDRIVFESVFRLPDRVRVRVSDKAKDFERALKYVRGPEDEFEALANYERMASSSPVKLDFVDAAIAFYMNTMKAKIVLFEEESSGRLLGYSFLLNNVHRLTDDSSGELKLIAAGIANATDSAVTLMTHPESLYVGILRVAERFVKDNGIDYFDVSGATTFSVRQVETGLDVSSIFCLPLDIKAKFSGYIPKIDPFTALAYHKGTLLLTTRHAKPYSQDIPQLKVSDPTQTSLCLCCGRSVPKKEMICPDCRQSCITFTAFGPLYTGESVKIRGKRVLDCMVENGDLKPHVYAAEFLNKMEY